MGEKWFFYSVHDAVVGCLRHQKARRHLRLRKPPAATAASTDTGGSEPTAASEVSDLEEGPELPLSRSQEARRSV